MKLTKEQIKANEDFFLGIIKMLPEGGRYVFPAEMAVFQKHYGILYATHPPNLDSITSLVSEDFRKKHFRVFTDIQNN